MNMYQKLKIYRKWLTQKQYLTLKGQIRAGDITAAEKGLQTILNK